MLLCVAEDEAIRGLEDFGDCLVFNTDDDRDAAMRDYQSQNSFGGDAITKLYDICQERMGFRLEVLVASSRTLLNSGVVFHQCI